MERSLMRIGSLFSGIGGLELGLEWAGVGVTVWQVEQDPFCRSILARHWPFAERHHDVTTVGKETLEPVDLICGGFPCQDVSGAGKGAGLAGSRSGLWFEFARIVGELRPRWVVVENVASGAKRWVDTVVAGLGEFGYEGLPIPLSAGDVGAPHKRARIFVVARRVSDAQRGAVGIEQQRLAEGRDARGVRDEGAAVAGDVGERLGDANGGRHTPRRLCGPGEAREAGRSGAWESVSGDGGEALRCGAAEPGRRGGDVAYASGRGTPTTQQPRQRGRAIEDGQRLANRNNDRCESERSGRLLDGERPTQRNDADGCGCSIAWPPRPDDLDAWQAFIADGGPEPALRRGPDGLPCGMARAEWKARLKALGNAVVPQCAEVIGHIVLELDR